MSFMEGIKGVFGFDIEKPKYELVCKIARNIEIRRYPSTRWASTSEMGEAHHLHAGLQTQMFWRLFNYISGQNDQGQKISITAPVIVGYDSFSPNGLIHPQTDCRMTMGFYVPNQNQNYTPKPTGKNTFLHTEPEMIVASITFDGFPEMKDYLAQRDQLIRALGDEAQNYDVVNFIIAGYDPPFKPLFRTNEIWLRKIK